MLVALLIGGLRGIPPPMSALCKALVGLSEAAQSWQISVCDPRLSQICSKIQMEVAMYTYLCIFSGRINTTGMLQKLTDGALQVSSPRCTRACLSHGQGQGLRSPALKFRKKGPKETLTHRCCGAPLQAILPSRSKHSGFMMGGEASKTFDHFPTVSLSTPGFLIPMLITLWNGPSATPFVFCPKHFSFLFFILYMANLRLF